MKNLDCRGLACPGPVIQVKKVLDEIKGGSFSIDVDSEASRDNVERFARSRGADVQVVAGPDKSTRLIITPPPDVQTGRATFAEASPGSHPDTRRVPPVVFITGDTLGEGDDKLGRILMEGFVNALPDQDRVPDRLLLMNAGVRLAAEGSTVLGALRKMTDRGCEVLVCGTCLEFFSLMDSLSVGTVSNMFDIQGALLEATSVIKV